MRDLHSIWDGDQGPVIRFRLRDGAGYRDLSAATACVYIQDANGVTLGTRPGVIPSARSDGYIDILLKGGEADWSGLGKELFLVPRVYYAQKADGTPATNALANPSFDTYSSGTGIADGWSRDGTLGPAVHESRVDDPAPPLIYGAGRCQRIYIPTTGSTSNIFQVPSLVSVPGDWLSGGVWRRAKLDAGAALQGEPGYYLRINDGNDSIKHFFPAGNTDWVFETVEIHTTVNHTTPRFNISVYDAIGYDCRFDEAFFFNGRWAEFHPDVYRLIVRPRVVHTRQPASLLFADHIAGRGGFESDTNGDGVCNGWDKAQGSTNTYSLEVDPDHVNTTYGGLGAQKVVLSGSSVDQLVLIARGKFNAGETWRFQVANKNSGALTGSPADGDYGIVLETEPFDGAFEQSNLTGANFSTGSVANYSTKSRTLALTEAHNVLVCKINLKTANGGTLWLDDAQLFRTV